MLETSPAGVAEVAKRVGYDAEAAFSKAFQALDRRGAGWVSAEVRCAKSSEASLVQRRSFDFCAFASMPDCVASGFGDPRRLQLRAQLRVIPRSLSLSSSSPVSERPFFRPSKIDMRSSSVNGRITPRAPWK